METSNSASGSHQIPEYWLPRAERAVGYLQQTAMEISDHLFGPIDGPDYGEVLGRYLFSVIAVAQEKEQPLTKSTFVEISRDALELVPIDQREHVSRVQADIANRGHGIWITTWSRLKETKPQIIWAGQTKDLNKSNVLTPAEYEYLDVLDALAEGWMVYRRPQSRASL